MPTKGTPKHGIRIPDALWAAAMQKARNENRKLSDIIRGWLIDYTQEDSQHGEGD